jgi:hypothetical protein
MPKVLLREKFWNKVYYGNGISQRSKVQMIERNK